MTESDLKSGDMSAPGGGGFLHGIEDAPEIAEELGISRSEARMAISTGRVAEYRLRAERDRYREALREILDSGGDRARGQLILIAREALDG